jgi:predicted Na+-dependent transporter
MYRGDKHTASLASDMTSLASDIASLARWFCLQTPTKSALALLVITRNCGLGADLVTAGKNWPDKFMPNLTTPQIHWLRCALSHTCPYTT